LQIFSQSAASGEFVEDGAVDGFAEGWPTFGEFGAGLARVMAEDEEDFGDVFGGIA
jgi:hypothetical protein